MSDRVAAEEAALNENTGWRRCQLWVDGPMQPSDGPLVATKNLPFQRTVLSSLASVRTSVASGLWESLCQAWVTFCRPWIRNSTLCVPLYLDRKKANDIAHMWCLTLWIPDLALMLPTSQRNAIKEYNLDLLRRQLETPIVKQRHDRVEGFFSLRDWDAGERMPF